MRFFGKNKYKPQLTGGCLMGSMDEKKIEDVDKIITSHESYICKDPGNTCYYLRNKGKIEIVSDINNLSRKTIRLNDCPQDLRNDLSVIVSK